MRRLLLPVIASAVLLSAGGAVEAKTVTVTITKNGYVPNSLSIVQGDTVQFTNGDTAAHQVSFKSTTGVTCSANPLVIQPAGFGTCTFANTGNYSYSDPNFKGNTYRGSITVTAPPESVTLAAKPVLLIYGGKTALSGVLSTQKTGENIDVLGQQCGSPSATKLATVQTTTGGAYSSSAQPLANTAYTSKHQNTSSSAVTVSVRPKLALAKVAAHRFSLKVTAGESLAGKYASFQRYNGTLKRWVALKTFALKAGTAPAPAMLATASFKSTVAAGLRVRATISQAQVGSCYAPGISNTIKS
jgi:plastocyanin